MAVHARHCDVETIDRNLIRESMDAEGDRQSDHDHVYDQPKDQIM